MLAYFGRRLLNLVLVLFAVVTAMFFLLHLAPGSPINTMPAAVTANPAARAAYAKALGLNGSLFVQYLDYLRGLATGNFGHSYFSGASVSQLIGQHLPVTIELCGIAAIGSLLPGFVVGAWVGMRSGGRADGIVRVGTVVSLSLPSFWLAVVAIVVLGSRFPQLLPQAGGFVAFGADPLGNLQVMIVPAFVLGLGVFAFLARSARVALVSVASSDYVGFAEAMGMRERLVLARIALRNAVIPVLTVAGVLSGTLLSGSVLVESIFQIPGIGQLMVTAYLQKDYQVALGTSIVIAAIFLATNLAIDMLNYVIDPRTKLVSGRAPRPMAKNGHRIGRGARNASRGDDPRTPRSAPRRVKVAS
ncbi:MAG: ABC transporter permease [Trebonia sp.]